MRSSSSLLLITLLAPGLAQAASNGAPAAVAPGSTGGFGSKTPACPTFHWGGVDGAEEMQLVVYRFDAPRGTELDVASLRPVLRVVLPGTSRGWTPSLDECFASGRRYAWAVRALGREGPSAWSRPLLFRVTPAPSPAEVSRAVQLLLRHSGRGGAPAPELQSLALATNRVSDSGSSPAAGPRRGPRTASIPGSAAFQAESGATSGDNHGVVGVTNSPEGFALAGENLGSGPDLLLRGEAGSPDAEVAEGFLDRPSDSDQVFDFRNSLAGGMSLQVEGVDVVTATTDLDTLAGLSCAASQVAQWNGSDWVCASTGTDTLAGLTCNGDQVVHWDGAAWVCGQPGLTHHTCSDSGFPGDCTVGCPAGSSVWAGGCTSGGNDYLKINGPTGGASGPSGWRCQSGDLLGSSSSVTVNLYCVAD